MNVDSENTYKLVQIDELKGKGLVAVREIKSGEVIFQEKPLVSCQFAWNKDAGYLACDHCMKPLETAEQNARRLSGKTNLILPYPECEQAALEIVSCQFCSTQYCSAECQKEAFEQYHQVLCLQTPQPNPDHPLEVLKEEWKKIHFPPEECNIMLLARIVASINQSTNPPELIDRYMQFCHRIVNERDEIAHKLLGKEFQQQIEHLRNLFQCAIATTHVEQWFTPEGFRTLFAIIGTNSQGIGTNPVTSWYNNVCRHLETRPDEKLEFEKFIDALYADFEQKTGYDFLDNEGSGLYSLQSCINHSCNPNAEVVFLANNYVLTVRAKRDIPAGEEICISYIPQCVIDSGYVERQMFLKENYLFKCHCTLCLQDSANESDDEMRE